MTDLCEAVSILLLVTDKIYLTDRFHVAVRLFSNRSQMTSKCGKNKKVAHEATAGCVTRKPAFAFFDKHEKSQLT